MSKALAVVLVLGLVLSVQAHWNGAKAGLGWSDGNSDNIRVLTGNTVGNTPVSWIYTWSAYSVQAASTIGLDFVPMLWGSSTASSFESQLNSGAFSNSTAVLGFNEPDQSGQSNMSPGTAVSLWWQYINPLKSSHGLRLGAPAVSSANSGLPWLQNFVSQCSGCSIDFIPIHWYGSNPAYFQSYVQNIYNTFGKPIWVTEFACVQYVSSDPACDQNGVDTFLQQTVTWLYAQNYVERFAWFGAMRSVPSGIPSYDALLTSNGNSLSQAGSLYISIKSNVSPAPPPATPAPAGPPTSSVQINAGIQVAIFSFSANLYVTVDPSSLLLVATTSSLSAAAKFNIGAISGGYTIQNAASGQYTSADNYGNSPAVANRPTASTWETWTFTALPNSGFVVIQASINGNLLAVQSNNELISNVPFAGALPGSVLFYIVNA